MPRWVDTPVAPLDSNAAAPAAADAADGCVGANLPPVTPCPGSATAPAVSDA
eukprot:SAG25_NODE_4354_length_835_cov_0.781250_2_plen_51_part_01